MDKKITKGKTILRIGCAVGGAVLFSGIGLPSVGAAVGSVLPEMLGEILDYFVENIADGKKKEEFLEKLLENSFERLAELGVHFASGRIDSYYESYYEANEGVLNFDFPRAVVKVWEKALNNMLPTKRETSILGLNQDYAREELLAFWRKKLQNAQSDNELLKEFFGKKPDYFLEIEKSGKKGFIEALPDEKEVENIFWVQIEKSFTNWANDENKLPKNWNKIINQDLIKELKTKLFQGFGSALKKELKENEKAWKSFEFASSLQIVSMLQTVASNIDQIKDDTGNIKSDLVDLIQSLPLMMKIVLNRFDALENTVKEFFISNQNISRLLIDFRKDVSEKLSEIGKDVSETKDYAKKSAENSEKNLNRFGDVLLTMSSIEKRVIANSWIEATVSESKTLEMLQIEIDILSNRIVATIQTALEKIPESDSILTEAELLELLGLLYYSRQDFDKSIVHHNEASQKFIAVDNYIRSILNQIGVGNSLLNNSNYKEAIEKYKKSIQLLEKSLE